MRIHNVFHVQLLEPYKENTIPGRIELPPPRIEIEGEQEYEVEAILNHRTNRRFKEPIRYLVKWLGYDETSWLPASALNNASDLVHAYNQQHNI